MPTYEYRCEACEHQFEQFQSITAEPLKKCPECGKRKLARLMGTGGGFIFKGSGFYITDYRSESYKKAAESEKSSVTPAAESKAGDAKPAESKPAASEAKPAAKPEAKPAGDAKKKSGSGRKAG